MKPFPFLRTVSRGLSFSKSFPGGGKYGFRFGVPNPVMRDKPEPVVLRRIDDDAALIKILLGGSLT
jgi:hypothetical protein